MQDLNLEGMDLNNMQEIDLSNLKGIDLKSLGLKEGDLENLDIKLDIQDVNVDLESLQKQLGENIQA